MPPDEGTEVAVVVGGGSGASGWRLVDGTRCLRNDIQRKAFRLGLCFFTDCLSRSSWVVYFFTCSSPRSGSGNKTEELEN